MNRKDIFLKIIPLFASLILIFSTTIVFAQDAVPGTALDFDGTNDYVNCGSSSSLSFGGTAPFTIEAWIKPHDSNASGSIITRYNRQVNGEYRIWIQDGKVNFHREVVPWTLLGNIVLQQNTWNHIAAVYDGTNMLLYINGEIDNILFNSGAIPATSNNVLIGASHQSHVPYGFFDGEIDEVRVWNVARNTYQILGNMHLTLSGTESGLVSYWQFNDSTGTTAIDPISGSDGVLVDMNDSDWITSHVAVGQGKSYQKYITSPGTYNFYNTDLSLEVTSLSQNQDITVTKINLAPNISPTYALDDTFDTQYWIVNDISNGTFSANFIFAPGEEITSEDETMPYQLRLFNRAKTSHGSWSEMMVAASANAGDNTVTFNSISTSNQFLIGKKIEPFVNQLSPADNSSNVALSADLIITFDRNITADNGNITIKKTENDSIFEIIPAVNTTINDSIIIIDLTDNFDLETGYYVLIDSNAFHDGSYNYFSGIHNKNTWNFQALKYFTEIDAGIRSASSGDVAWGDYDNDNDLDILLTGFSGTSGTGLYKLYRNDPSAGSDRVFTEINAGLAGIFSGTSEWGDFDNDNYLDVLITGTTKPFTQISRVYRNGPSGNEDRIFTNIDAGLPGLTSSTANLGDYDNDGDLDVFVSGSNGQDFYSGIYRNDPPTSGAERIYTYVFGLTGIKYCSAAWGDSDNDGDLDIVIVGQNSSYTPTYRFYRNDGQKFTSISVGITPVHSGSVDWGDYDNDGDLDLLVTGNTVSSFQNPVTSAIIYRNNSGSFTNINAGLTGVFYSDACWGDYDNDGDLDIFLTGKYNSDDYMSTIYRNDSGVFTPIDIGTPSGYERSAAWGDYDNDGDLDLLYSGYIYRNNSVIPNSLPLSPDGLNVTTLTDTMLFSWNKSSDSETPQDGMSYNLVLGNSEYDVYMNPPMADINSGSRSVAALGNVCQVTSWTYYVPDFYTYTQVIQPDYWGVQAIDHTFAGSPFATDSLNFPINFLPVFNNEVMNLQDLLAWDIAHIDSVVSYQIQIDDDSTFVSCDVDDILSLPHNSKLNKTSDWKYAIKLSDLAGSDSLIAGIKYYWRIRPNYIFGLPTAFTKRVPHFWFGFITGTNEAEESGIPKKFALQQNYPNPFNPVTMINYQLSKNSNVVLSVYNLLGQKVATLVSEEQNAGYHQVEWDASQFSSGIYYYRIEAGEFQKVRKMVYLK